jgi:uncharacterized protein YndB with AHSA1/START domain
VNPVRIAGIVLGSIALLLFTILIIGFLLPSGWEVERTARIEAPPEVVFPYLDQAEAWERWTPSPESGTEAFGPGSGIGSGRRWDDDGYGRGEFVITASDAPVTLSYRVEVEGGAIRIEGTMTLTPEEGGTTIRWREVGDFGWNPILGYLSGRMEALQGSQLEASLVRLAQVVLEDLEEAPVSPPPDSSR